MILLPFVRGWTSWPMSVPEHNSNKIAPQPRGHGLITLALMDRVPTMSERSRAPFAQIVMFPQRELVPGEVPQAVSCGLNLPELYQSRRTSALARRAWRP
jgi:hypothetical protein